MRALRSLVLISLMLFSLLAILGSGWWLYTANTLANPVESEMDLETFLKQSIESDRQSLQFNKRLSEREKVTWTKPDFSRLPKNLVALYITEWGCPTYFQSPREDGYPWTKRQFLGLINIEPPGDGWCEQLFGGNLSYRIGAKGSLEMAVATHKIHRFLKKDTLIAYDLHSIRLAPGIIGVEDGARALFKKPLADMNLAEIAEYALALPPNGYWDQMRNCQNPTLIRQARDQVILRLQMVSLIPESEGIAARNQPVACLRTE